jgi:ketosteroid isomerase-like protein
MSEIVNQFYGAIRSGDVGILDALIDQDFQLNLPNTGSCVVGCLSR